VTHEIAERAEIRPVGPDDLADVRSLHATSFRLLAGGSFTEEEIAAFTAHVYSINYTTALSEAVQRQQIFAARIDNELVGTAGWVAGDGSVATARIRWVFVRPMFTGIGLGTKLVRVAEAAAQRAGFDTLSVEATLNAVGFFEQLGFEVSSHGVRALAPTQGLPVAFMRKSVEEESAQTRAAD
jgi:GNAT superfamily N-acetyltransferase